MGRPLPVPSPSPASPSTSRSSSEAGDAHHLRDLWGDLPLDEPEVLADTRALLEALGSAQRAALLAEDVGVDDEPQSPLMAAVECESLAMVQLLLESGAVADADPGNAPLAVAAGSGSWEV